MAEGADRTRIFRSLWLYGQSHLGQRQQPPFTQGDVQRTVRNRYGHRSDRMPSTGLRSGA